MRHMKQSVHPVALLNLSMNTYIYSCHLQNNAIHLSSEVSMTKFWELSLTRHLNIPMSNVQRVHRPYSIMCSPNLLSVLTSKAITWEPHPFHGRDAPPRYLTLGFKWKVITQEANSFTGRDAPPRSP